jgi:hypothetical protein
LELLCFRFNFLLFPPSVIASSTVKKVSSDDGAALASGRLASGRLASDPGCSSIPSILPMSILRLKSMKF